MAICCSRCGRPDRDTLLAGRLAQGITTEVIGNCGLGAAPLFWEARDLAPAVHAWMTPEGASWRWSSLADYFSALETRGLPLNVAALVPHGLLRLGAMGLRPGRRTVGSGRRWRGALEQSLEEGAYGLSCGLIYPPGMFSATEELLGLARSLRESDGVFTAHVRGSSETLLPAVEELIEIAGAPRSGCTTATPKRWVGTTGRSSRPFSRWEREARAEGVRVSADMFPYPVAATMMYAIYPPWALEGGPGELFARLRDPEVRARIGRDIEERTPEWPPWEPGGWPHNLVSAVGWGRHSGFERGKRRLARRRVVCLSPNSGIGAPHSPSRRFPTSCWRRTAQWGSSCWTSAAKTDSGRSSPIPRWRSSPTRTITGRAPLTRPPTVRSPRVLGRYVREEGLLSLEEAVRRMTSLPADIVGLRHRGRIANGFPADLVLFDKEEIADHATLENPRARATGIRVTFVDGQPVSRDGRFTGALPGRVLRRST